MGLFTGFNRESRSNTAQRENFKAIPGLGQDTDNEASLAIPAVYACVDIIASQLSTLPLDVFRKNIAAGTRDEINTPVWLRRPNPFMTSSEFRMRIFTSLLIQGNAFIYVLRNDRGDISSLEPISPDRVKVAQDSLGKYFTVDGNQEDKIRLDRMLHIVKFITAGALEGVSPITQARNTMDLAAESERYGKDFYKANLKVQGVIETGQNVKSVEEIDLMMDSFNASRKDPSNPGIAVLTGGSKWNQVTLSPKDAEYLESRKYNANQIAAMYHVPPYMIDPTVTSTWGTGIAEQNINFVRMTLLPWIVAVEQAITDQLLAGSQYVKFNLSGLLRGTDKERAEIYRIGLQAGYITINEIRRLEDLPELPGGDSLFVPSNMLPLNDVLAGKYISQIRDSQSQNGITDDGGTEVEQST